MFRVNRYILLFMAITFIAISMLWNFVQSEKFANFIVNEISQRFLDKENVKLDVQNVEISLFPPATDLRNVSLSIENKDFKLSAITGRASVEFSFINLLSSDLVVDKIRIADSSVQYKAKGRNNETESLAGEGQVKEILKDLRGAVGRIHSEIPFSLNSLEMDNVIISNVEDSVKIHHSELRLYENYLIGDVVLRSINVQSWKERERELKELDQVSFSLEMADNYVNLSDLKIKRMLDAISGQLGVRFDNDQLQGEIKYFGGLDWPLGIARKNSELDIEASGFSETTVAIEGTIDNMSFGLNTEIHNLVNKNVKADYVNLKARYSGGTVVAEEATLKNKDGNLKLREDVVVFDEKDGLTSNKVKMQASNLSADTAFYAIRDVLGIVKGRLYGDVDIQWREESRSVEFTVPTELTVKDFVLSENNNTPILINPEIKLSETKVALDIGSGVYIDTAINFGGSGFKVKGRVADNEVAFVTSDGVVDFSELGPIAGTEIFGKGDFGLKVYGPEDDVIFDVSLDTRDASLLDYQLGEIEADLLYSLRENSLEVESFKGRQGDSSYLGIGEFLFDEKESGFQLKLETEKMSYIDSRKVLAPLFDQLDYVPEELSFLGKGEFRVEGRFKEDELAVSGPLSLSYIDFYGEVVDSLNLQVGFENGNLSLKDILLEKGESLLKGSFTLNTNTRFIEYDGRWDGIRPNDFRVYRQLNLGLETNASLDIYGSGTPDDLTTRLKLETKNSRVQGVSFGESRFTVFGESDQYEIEGDFFDKSITVSSLVDFKNTDGQNSHVDANLNFSDVRELLGVLSAHNSQRDDLRGSVKAQLESSFSTKDLKNLDLHLVLNKLDVLYKGIKLETDENRELLISGGVVKESNFELYSSEYYITPLLRGSLTDGFALDVGYMLPLSLLELITPEIEISKGQTYGVVAIGGTLEDVESYAEANVENVVMQTSYIPGAMRNGQMRAVLDNKILKIDSLKANYGKGNVEGSGQIILDFPFPIVKMKGSVSDAFIPLMNRSGLVVSGQFNLTGEEVPYRLDGDVTLLFAEILEDINEFQKQQASSNSYQRFLPQSEGRQRELFDLNLNINVQRPIQVRNSLLELNIDGEAKVTGPPSLPRPQGRFQVVPSSSKFKFKGHEFNLTKGTIELGEDFNREGARLDFSGITQINEYKVRLNVSGRTKNVEVSLSSEPGLSQENLFSLLTLGVTSEVSTELDENERQSVATVGLGALLADQLKLNEGLDSSFGLRLSVLPEYAEESDALLQGKSAVSESGTNRFRSSTKVRVQKKISDKVDLSVSSTVGGSLEQRQEMNVNYKFNNKWSLEGVYELKSTDDEGVESSDSIGADLKYRWSF